MRVKYGFEKNQRHVYSDKGMISLIFPSKFTMNMFEIYPIDYDKLFFEDVERFSTEKEALQRCKEILG